jgi:hypothetical protein
MKRRITMGFASVASGAVLTVTAVLAGMGSCAPPVQNPTPPGGSTAPVTAGPTTTGVPARLPIYYLGQASDRTVLYREWHTVPVAGSLLPTRISAALTEMLRNDPLDPDYSGAWPAGATVREVRIEGSVAVVDLGGVAANNVGSLTAAMSVQQLVWTVTATAADAGSPLSGVRLLVDGSARSELWGAVDIDGELRRGDAVSEQAPVWLISPQEGETVGRNVRVHIDGHVTEATAHLRVRAENGTIVYDRFVMLSAGAPQRGEAFVDLTLAPGRYTIEAFYYSLRDDSIQAMDDHAITVS